MTYYGLLDCNNFFVSCERLFRPDLAGRPVVVLSSNDGCVVARSQEVKDLGVPMGIPHFKVRDELEKHQVAVFSSNFTLYRDVSARVMSVLSDLASGVEQYSVDEAFFKLEINDPKLIENQLSRIKQTIEESVGIPVSLGAGRTKTIAKYASTKAKRERGYCLLAGQGWQNEQNHLSLSNIWGVGGATARNLRQQGVTTVSDFLSTDHSRIEQLLGAHGLRLFYELSEQPTARADRTKLSQKSIMSTRSFAQKTTDLSVLEDAVAYHLAYAARELRELGGQAWSLRVILQTNRHGDWALRGGSLEVTLPTPSSDTRVLLKAAYQLIKDLYEPGIPYKKAGVVLSRFTTTKHLQPELFPSELAAKDDKLMTVVDFLNQKLGKDKVTIGRLADSKVWQASRQYCSPEYTTNWQDLAVVKAA